MRKEIEVLEKFIRAKGLRYTPQREDVLKVFLSVEKHVSADELYKLVRRKNPKIGYTTVYRTMRVLADAELCTEVDFDDGITRFEHKYAHEHHDHLICIKCKRCIEVLNPEIEKLQDVVASGKNFIPLKHKLQIFGVCGRCSKRR